LPLIGAAALLVLLISITVYGKTNSYGEAALSLIGGLLTVFSVNWTPAYFWIFTGVLVGFSLSALLISSIKLAANVEDIYIHAAVSLSDDSDEVERLKTLLEAIGKKHPTQGTLGPVYSRLQSG
jgi:hypothetical protein